MEVKLQKQIALSAVEAEYIALEKSMCELVGVRELLREVYSIVLKYSEVHTEYHTIYKDFGAIPQSIIHEYNITCLKFYTVANISPQTKHIAIPYHFFQTKIEQIETKVVTVSPENQLAYQFTKGLPEKKFLHSCFVIMGW